MLKGLLGKKIGMTQIFDDNGTAIPVTIIEAGPCYVTQVRSVEKLLIAKHKPLWNYSKIPAPPRQASWWRNLWMVATGVLVAFILQHSVMLGLMAAVVAIALFR